MPPSSFRHLRPLATLFLAAAFANAALAVEVVISEEDFDGVGNVWGPTGRVSNFTGVADPEMDGTRGTVSQVELTGGGEWGGIETIPPQILTGITDRFYQITRFPLPPE